MRYTDSGKTAKGSLQISRKFVSSRLAEELLGKAYGYLILPGKRSASKPPLEKEENVHTSVSSV